jgi:hypothetical protein
MWLFGDSDVLVSKAASEVDHQSERAEATSASESEGAKLSSQLWEKAILQGRDNPSARLSETLTPLHIVQKE